MNPVDKILGADVELGNVIQRSGPGALSNDFAARCLLAEIEGVPGSASSWSAYGHTESGGGWSGYAGYPPVAADVPPQSDPQDWGRKFLSTNGGCAYIDLGHLEICMPEVRSALDFVRYHHAGLALARAAREAADARRCEGERLVVMANNSDRQGNSWGGHVNVLVTRELWQRIFARMYPDLFVLAAFQVSSILYTGQGKVGSENGKPWVPFQITQRGDFFECIEGEQTTYRRPIVNSRDEAHCGPAQHASGLARLHVIFHDTTLTHTSNYLKAGVTQLVLALMETGWCDRQVILENPLEALTAWGHSPDLQACAVLADGRSVTAVEHQRLFLDAVKPFVAKGDATCVPEAQRIVATWEDTLDRLERRDTAVLARRLDWVLKRELLARAIARGVAWDSPSIRAADLRFASLNAGHGLFDAVAAGGGVDTLLSPEDIQRACQSPPDDTRAWARTMLLRHAGQRGIESVTWDEVRLRPVRPGGQARVIRLVDPRRHGRAELLRQRETAQAAARGQPH
jgi:Pup amidohydrolase